MTNPFTRAWSAWCRFWFTPADPTPLCLMRIVAGLLALYVHVAYTFDLQALVGPNGWYPTAMADRERREFPIFIRPAIWPGAPREALQIRMPENGGQRRALRVFIDNLAANPAGQERAFHLLGELPRTDLEGWLDTFKFLRALPRDPAEREDKLRNLVEAPADDADPQRREVNERLFGRFLLGLNAQRREQFRIDAHALAELLPADQHQRQELFDLLILEGPTGVDALQTFVRHVTADCPTAAQREAYLDFMEYWSAPPDDPDLIHKGHPVYSPFFHVTSRAGINTIHALHLAVIILFTLGVWTRVTSVLTWLAGLAYIQRNPLALFGQDTMMNLCLFYLMLAPCGAVWSVDWLVRRYRTARARLSAGAPGRAGAEALPRPGGPTPLVSANVVIRLLQVQYCLMYLSAGLSKLKGQNWWNGTAVWYTMTNPEFSPLHIPVFRYILHVLCQDEYRWVWEIYMSSLAVFTLTLEIGLPFLVWTRLRPLMIFGAILLHLGIALNMGLVVFSLFMFTLLLAWMPPEAIRRVFARPPARLPKLQVQFDAADPRRRRAAALVYAADVWNQTELEEKPVTAVEVVSGGTATTGVAAACRLVRDLGLTQPVGRLLSLLMRLPGLSHLVAATFGEPSETRPVDTPSESRKRPRPVASR
jgi:hypothetical protein